MTSINVLGWTLLHFLWQGALIALLLAVSNRLLRGASAHVRYLSACGALALMLLCAMATFMRLRNDASANGLGVGKAFNTMQSREVQGSQGPTQSPTVNAVNIADGARAASARSSRSGFEVAALQFRWLSGSLPWMVYAWMAGVCLLALRSFGGWIALQNFKRNNARAAELEWQRRMAVLARRLRISRAVTLCESAVAQVPAVVGWLRPVVLLPVSAISGLTPEQLESLLVHELAHIRRHDYLVNLFQTCVETILFYHPAVWWVGSRIRTEREHCCDDLAVEVCGDALTYARALTRMEQLRCGVPALAMAANGGPLLQRIQRLLPTRRSAHSALPREGSLGWIAGAALTFLMAAGWATPRLSGLSQATAPKEQVQSARPAQSSVSSIPSVPSAPSTVPDLPAAQDLTPPTPAAPPAAAQAGQQSEPSLVPEAPDPSTAPTGGVVAPPALRRPIRLGRPPRPAKAPTAPAGLAVPAPARAPSPAAVPVGVGVPVPAREPSPAAVHVALAVLAPRPGRWQAYGSGGSDETGSGGSSLIDELEKAGYHNLTPDQLIALKIQGVNGEYVRAIRAEGYQPTVDQLLAFRIHGVTPQYIAQFKDFGWKPDADHLVAFRIHGVDPVQVRKMKDLGYALNPDQAVAMRIHGLTPELAGKAKTMGLGDPTFDELLAMRIHGADASYLTGMKDAGLRDLTFDKLLALRIHGADPGQLKEFADLGFKNLSADDVIAARIFGVTPEFVRETRKRGYKDLTLQQIVKLKQYGILDKQGESI